jgi:hypothetical protein
VVKIKRTSPEHPQQFQGVLRLAEGSKRVILSTSRYVHLEKALIESANAVAAETLRLMHPKHPV